MTVPARTVRPIAALVAVVLATACGAAGPATSIARDPGAIYADFPECGPLPAPSPHDPVEGLVQPDGMVVVEVRRTGPITAVTGFVDATPLELRDAFAGRPGVEVISVEDEGFEAEVLVDSGDFRTFLKATIRCRTGSIVALVVARDADAEQLPTPAGR